MRLYGSGQSTSDEAPHPNPELERRAPSRVLANEVETCRGGARRSGSWAGETVSASLLISGRFGSRFFLWDGGIKLFGQGVVEGFGAVVHAEPGVVGDFFRVEGGRGCGRRGRNGIYGRSDLRFGGFRGGGHGGTRLRWDTAWAAAVGLVAPIDNRADVARGVFPFRNRRGNVMVSRSLDWFLGGLAFDLFPRSFAGWIRLY